jgi:hypothetical protein
MPRVFSPHTSIAIYDPLGPVPGATAFGSATFPAANRALLLPFRVVEASIVKQIYVVNGATASGNIDVGIYAPDGTRIISSGSTAQSGTSVMQVFNVTDTLIDRGYYYMAVAMDNTTGTLLRNNISAQNAKYQGFAAMESAFPLPATVTPATSPGYLPVMGVDLQGLV